MEARRRVEFTGVELTSDTKLTAPVEKATTGSVEEAAAGPCALEARGEREAWWRGSKTGCCALARWRCHLVEWRHSGEGGAVEREVRWRARSRSRGDLSRRYGEVGVFFRTVQGEWMST
jgi:hypothetical protein